jgi:arsenate reductase
MAEATRNVLFLCTGNSARSLLAECAMNRHGEGRLRGLSAGSHPGPAPHPLAIELLRALGYDTSDLRSKSWETFAGADAPALDFVITLCDAARGEACPVWPGHPLTAHWGVADPAACDGSPDERRAAFRRAYDELEPRIARLAALPLAALDRDALRDQLDRIGRERAPDGT